MEHQSWSVQNYYSYSCREAYLLAFNLLQVFLKSAFLMPAFLALFLYLLVAMLILVEWRFPGFDILGLCMVFTLILSLVIGVLSALLSFLATFSVGFLLHQLIPPVTLEVSQEGLQSSVSKRIKGLLFPWSSIKNISQRFNLIFIEYRHHFIPKCLVISPRVFKDQAEGERFYADLNYFWEQGR